MTEAIGTAIIVAVIGLQTFWISRSLGRNEAATDGLSGRLDGLGARLEGLGARLDAFRSEVHQDMATHTEAITDLRERVARLEA